MNSPIFDTFLVAIRIRVYRVPRGILCPTSCPIEQQGRWLRPSHSHSQGPRLLSVVRDCTYLWYSRDIKSSRWERRRDLPCEFTAAFVYENGLPMMLCRVWCMSFVARNSHTVVPRSSGVGVHWNCLLGIAMNPGSFCFDYHYCPNLHALTLIIM